MSACCRKFKEAVEAEDIVVAGLGDDTTFWIHGRPHMASDGDGYFDDMTCELKIAYCPFCGAKATRAIP